MADALFANHRTQEEEHQRHIENLNVQLALALGPDADWQNCVGPFLRQPRPAWINYNKIVTAAIKALGGPDNDKKVRCQAIMAMMNDANINHPRPMTTEILTAIGTEIISQYEANCLTVVTKKAKDEEKAEQARMQRAPKREKEEDTNPIKSGITLNGPHEVTFTEEFRAAIGVDKDHATQQGLKVWQSLKSEDLELFKALIAQPAGRPIDKAAIVGPLGGPQGRLYEFALEMACRYADAKHDRLLDHEMMIHGLGGAPIGGGCEKYAKKEPAPTAQYTPPPAPRRLLSPGVTPTQASPTPAQAATPPGTVATVRVLGPPKPGICLKCGLKHVTELCQMDLTTLQCLTCHEMGHGSGICPRRRF